MPLNSCKLLMTPWLFYDPINGTKSWWNINLIPFIKSLQTKDKGISKHPLPMEGKHNFDGLMQERRSSIANALELRLSFTDPSIYYFLSFLNTVPTHIGRQGQANFMLNIMPVDVLATQGARTSAGKMLIYFLWDIPCPAQKGWTKQWS